MVAALLVVDGASEPVRPGAPTSLERARTPALDALAAEAVPARVRTVPHGLPAGSETAIPALLGWMPGVPIDRGLLEAAARGVEPPPGDRAWRVDALGPDGGRGDGEAAARAAALLLRLAPRHRVLPVGGHRMLVVGPPPLPVASGRGLRVWPAGASPRRILDGRTVMVAAPGAAAGAARLMGARVVVPEGATGRLDTDLAAKAACAVRAIRDGAGRVVVHVAAPDEASHLRDAAAKVAAIERIDRELLPPLVEAVTAAGGVLRVCADHGCDPASGRHDACPVPALAWAPAGRPDPRGTRFTERAVAGLAIVDSGWATAPVAM